MSEAFCRPAPKPVVPPRLPTQGQSVLVTHSSITSDEIYTVLPVTPTSNDCDHVAVVKTTRRVVCMGEDGVRLLCIFDILQSLASSSCVYCWSAGYGMDGHVISRCPYSLGNGYDGQFIDFCSTIQYIKGMCYSCGLNTKVRSASIVKRTHD